MSLTIKKILFISVIFLIGTLFCPLFFNQIPFPLGSAYFWMLSVVIIIIIDAPEVLISKQLRFFYLYFVIYFVGYNSFWADREASSQKFLFTSAYIYLPILMNEYFRKKNNKILYGKVVLISIVIIAISSLYYVFNVFVNPGIIRGHVLAGSLLEIYTYGYFYAVIFLLPLIIYFTKKVRYFGVNNIRYYLIMGIILFSVILSQYVTAVMFAIIMIASALLSAKNRKKNVIIFTTMFILLIIVPQETKGGILHYLAKFLPNGYIQDQFNDFGNTISLNDFSLESDKTYFSRVRLSLLDPVVNSFGSNIVIGSNVSSGHFFWIDQFAMFGLLGLYPWFLIFQEFFKSNAKHFSEDFKPYLVIALIAYFIMGLVKGGMIGWHSLMTLFFLLPGFNFIPIKLKKINSKRYENSAN